MGITTSNKMWGLVLGALVLTLILTSTVFVSGCADNAKQLCNSTDTSNCSGAKGAVGCYEGACTSLCTQKGKCSEGYECISVDVSSVDTKAGKYCVAEKKPATTTTATPTAGETSPSASLPEEGKPCELSQMGEDKGVGSTCDSTGKGYYFICSSQKWVKNKVDCGKNKCEIDDESVVVCKKETAKQEGVTTTNEGGPLPSKPSSGGTGGASSLEKIFSYKLPAEVFQGFLMKFLVMFLLIFAIVYVALQSAKFPKGDYGHGYGYGASGNLFSKTRFLIAVVFGLMAAIVIAANPGLFPVEIMVTKFIMFLFIIVFYFILMGLAFGDKTPFGPKENTLKSFESGVIALVFVITMVTMLFLDTPIQLALENKPLCVDETWNSKCTNDAPDGCLAVDYSSGRVVCCNHAYKTTAVTSRMGDYLFCSEVGDQQNNLFVPLYSPGVTKNDDAVCKFDMNLSMPLPGHNMCAVLGDFLVGPATYQEYKNYLQLGWLLAAALLLLELGKRFKDKSKWFFGALLGIGFFHFILGVDFFWSTVITGSILAIAYLWWKMKKRVLRNAKRANKMKKLVRRAKNIITTARKAKGRIEFIKAKRKMEI